MHMVFCLSSYKEQDIDIDTVTEVVCQIVPTLLYLYIYFTHININYCKYQMKMNNPQLAPLLLFSNIPIIYITLQRATNRFHGIMQYTNTSSLSAIVLITESIDLLDGYREMKLNNKDKVLLYIIAMADAITVNDPNSTVLAIIAVIVRLVLVFADLISNTNSHFNSRIPLVTNVTKQATKQATMEAFPQVITVEINMKITEPRDVNSNQSQFYPLYQFPFPSQYSYIPPCIFKQLIRQKQITQFSLQYSNYALQQCGSSQWNISAATKPPQQTTQVNHKMMANTNTNATNRQNIYKMTSKPRGIAVTINNEKFIAPWLKLRLGSTVDVHTLCNLFSYLSFNPQHHENKTHSEMRQILNDVAGMDHDKYDCLIVAILTHGDYGDVLYGTSGGITKQEVIETFSGKRCPTLIGKPKIFIIQACRGRRRDNQTIQLNDTNSDECDMIDSGHTIYPKILDYLVAYSTIPGHASFRNNKTGSIFISALVKIFRRFSADEDLITMLERVTDEVIRYEPQGDGLQYSRQTPEVHSTLRGKVYFNVAGKCKCD